MTTTAFTQMLATLEQHTNQLTIALPADWLQGRTAYGGLSAALCLEATLRTTPDLPPLRSAQFAYAGPATGILRITSTVLRQGKSTVFTSVDLEGENGLAVRAVLCFGVERSSALDHVGLPMPMTPPLDDCPAYFDRPDIPTFMRHFEGRLAAGAKPVTPGASPEMLVWLRHRDEYVGDGLVGLLALADALPPAAMVLFHEMAPISTMTWSIDMLTNRPTSETGWWLVQCVAETARLGYSAQSTVIWDPTGRPILIARQNVAIFQ
ncbi:MAG: thioesterase family protein [Beijerinckiaceae bacterium]